MSKAKADTPEQAEFREYCRNWLNENKPAVPDFAVPKMGIDYMTEDQIQFAIAWQKSAYAAGLVGCDYPKEVGGAGRNNCQIVANSEMNRAKTPSMPGIIGLGMGAPTVFFHGSDELKQKLLPKLFSGDEIWCQGFSEPGAGSDLASAQTFAEKKGDKWIINGHKVWTSCAHFAQWMILLARTDKSDKYKGLTYFVVPIEAGLGKGVTVRPLIKITGETGFNEVLFDNYEIPDEYRLDEVGNGWAVAMTTLAHERGAGKFMTPASGGMYTTGKQDREEEKGKSPKEFPLISLAKNSIRNGKPAIEDPIIRDKVMKALVHSSAIKQQRRFRKVKGLCENPQRFALQDKLIGTDYVQYETALGMEIAGSQGTLYVGDENAPNGGKWPKAFMSSFAGTIAGGTNEIQRNILGERVLGLAKSK
jgi:alkylation response protein AidB-like acyl-CoA dehydrogenase